MTSPFPSDPFSPSGQPPNPFGPPNPAGPTNPFEPPQPAFGTPPSNFATGVPGPYPPYAGPNSRLSLLALASMIFGTGGLLTCCCAPLALPSSLLAVITGHTALIFINRTGSQLNGKALAAIGLAGGYLGLLLSGGILLAGWLNPNSNNRPDPPGMAKASDALREVETKILSDNQGIAHGNTPAAVSLAQDFADTMKQLRDENFTKGEGGISLSGGNFVTYCELRPGQCAFVVHVPEYRKFEDDAKDSLADLAWEAAQSTVEGTLAEGDKLAVGLKGTLLFGSVMVGSVAGSDDPGYGMDDRSEDRDRLLPFFEPDEPDAEPMEPNIELPPEGSKSDGDSPPAGDEGPPECKTSADSETEPSAAESKPAENPASSGDE